MTAIKTEKLRKEYKDVVAVDDLDLEIKEGELFSLLGVNGAGKTTTIKMLTTLAKPTAGEAFILGNPITGDREKITGIVDVSMQQTAVARNLTVEENLEFYCAIKGVEKQRVAEVKQRMYQVFGLGKVAKKRAKLLSGGWQRKLSIALSLVGDPKVLFLDEPTTFLDIQYQIEILDRLYELNQKKQITILMVLHDINLAVRYSHQLFALKKGKLVAQGEPKDILTSSLIKEVYGLECKIIEDPYYHCPMVLPIGKHKA